MRERDAWLALLNGWGMPDGWTGRDFFARWIALDPTWRDDNVWVAEDAGRLVSAVQIFPRELRVLGHAVPTGGIGSVYTREEHRRSGIAGSILDAVVVSMRERGMELSLLFGTRFDFYAKHGWESWQHPCAWLSRSGRAQSGAATAGDIGIGRFDWERDLGEMKALSAAYSSARSGTLIRDAALWEASFDLAGNPIEDVAVVSAGLFPRRYFVHFKSGLPDSCHKFDKSDVDRNGGVINIAVTNLKPRGPAECTDTRRMVNRVVALGSDFRAGDTYRVRVNAVPETLVARGIWAYKQISEKANKGLRTRSCRSQPGAHF